MASMSVLDDIPYGSDEQELYAMFNPYAVLGDNIGLELPADLHVIASVIGHKLGLPAQVSLAPVIASFCGLAGDGPTCQVYQMKSTLNNFLMLVCPPNSGKSCLDDVLTEIVEDVPKMGLAASDPAPAPILLGMGSAQMLIECVKMLRSAARSPGTCLQLTSFRLCPAQATVACLRACVVDQHIRNGRQQSNGWYGFFHWNGIHE